MIITSSIKLEPGKYYDESSGPFQNADEIIEKYKFLVIREATQKEYRNYVVETFPASKAGQIIDYDYFYEIHSD